MIEQDEAHALRRYVRNRTAGRPAPEYARFDPVIQGWLESNETEAAGRCDGRAFRQVRRPGLPWCEWLGLDTRIAEDHALQAFFELRAKEGHDWLRLLKEVARNRQAALRDWRREGFGILSRLRAQEALRPDVRLHSTLADEFRMPGRGMRSLRKS
ncbi:hypothetical protein [Mesorhizobium sp. B2-4-6]|uniref:hypothetical protein n=1 Tax=Mesorhizobium sp. B2-4-6 TaxID=2589943 RepID=UPI001129C75D|nr:hypothetical protein [Mesorhizobium sp. B2-4-6]TPL45327.1 hypothetical protein FJ957_20675 [Mesorhizobium sp. B2-4-6]